MADHSIPIIDLEVSALARISQLLAEAFHNDPFIEYICPDPHLRPAIIQWLFGRTVHYGALYGRVETTPELQGVGVWLGPEHASMSLRGMAKVGLLMTPFKLGLGVFVRLTRFAGRQSRLHKRSIRGRHWYLLLLAVHPGEQGRGLGAALIRRGLERADAEGLPTYLETLNADNVRIFEKYGFKVRGEDEVAGGPHIWGMVRPPRGG